MAEVGVAFDGFSVGKTAKLDYLYDLVAYVSLDGGINFLEILPDYLMTGFPAGVTLRPLQPAGIRRHGRMNKNTDKKYFNHIFVTTEECLLLPRRSPGERRRIHWLGHNPYRLGLLICR